MTLKNRHSQSELPRTVSLLLGVMLLGATIGCKSSSISETEKPPEAEPKGSSTPGSGSQPTSSNEVDSFELSLPPNLYANTAIRIQWTKPTGAISFRLVAAHDSSCSDAILQLDNLTGTEQSLTFPSEGKYFICLFAVFDDHTAQASNSGMQLEVQSEDAASPVPGNSGTLTYDNVTTTAVRVNWTAASDDVSAPADLAYLVYYSTANNIGSVSDAETNGTAVGSYAANTTQVNVGSLAAGTTYYFTVLTKDEAGNKASYTASSQATSAAADVTAPTPGNSGTLTYDNVTTSAVRVNWTAASDDVSAPADLAYLVYYSTANNIGSVSDAETNGTAVGSYAANTTQVNVGSLAAGTTYYFTVLTKDEAGNKAAYTSSSQATSAAADVTAPTPGNSGTLTYDNVTTTAVRVNWTAASDDVSAPADLAYLVYYSTANNIGSVSDAETNGTAVGSYAANTTQVNVGSLAAGTTYYFTVLTKDEAGNKASYTASSQATSAAADVTAPTPGNSGTLTYDNVTTSAVRVNWTAASDDVSAPADLAYLVYYSTANNIGNVSDAETNGTAVGSYAANTTQVNVGSLAAGTTYYFTVLTKDEAGNKAAYTSSSQATSAAADVTAPTPGNSGTISSANIGETSLDLSWAKASDNISAPSALVYFVYRSSSNNLSTVADAELNGAQVASGTDIATANITGLSNGTAYYFNVVVQDEASNKAVYTTISATTNGSNTAPSLTTNNSLMVAETSNSPLSSVYLSSSDSTDFPSDIIYTLKSAPAYGSLKLAGSSLTSGGTFTQSDIEDGKISYHHTGADQTDDGFTFSVQDDEGLFASSATDASPATFTIVVQGDQLWEHTYNYSNNGDRLFDAAVDSSGNVYLGGYSSGKHWWFKKLDASGNELWNRTKDGNGGDDEIQAVVVDSNDDVFFAGYGTNIVSVSSGRDWWLSKRTPSGTLIWEREYDGNGGNDVIHAAAIDSNGDLYIAGSGANLVSATSGSDWWVKKIDSSGTQLWEMIYEGGAEGADIIHGVAIDSGDNVYLGGFGTNLITATSLHDWWVKKLSPDGSLIWEQKYDGNADSDKIFSVKVDALDNVYLGGWGVNVVAGASSNDVWVKKLDSSGSGIWEKQLDGGSSGLDSAREIGIDSSGNVFVAGYGFNLTSTKAGGSQRDWWIMKFTSAGTMIWERQFHLSDYDSIESLAIDTNDHLYVVGWGLDLVGSSTGDDWWIKKMLP